jgi:hypothetical protein
MSAVSLTGIIITDFSPTVKCFSQQFCALLTAHRSLCISALSVYLATSKIRIEQAHFMPRYKVYYKEDFVQRARYFSRWRPAVTNTVSQQPDPSDHRHRGLRAPTIECQICQAVYAPAEEYRYLAQAPQVALESAFMSMCHFCFRCRRPACPQCWDHVHGVCGECSQEANLPFRSQAAPLRGVLFPSTRQEQLRRKQAENLRLLCINPGRFQTLAPIDEAETTPYIRKNIRQTSNIPQNQSTTHGVPLQPAHTTVAPPRNYPRTHNIAPRHTSLIASSSPPAPTQSTQSGQSARSVRPPKTGTEQFAYSTDMLYPVPVPPLPHGKLTDGSTTEKTGSIHAAASPLTTRQQPTQAPATSSPRTTIASTEAATRPEPPVSKRITKKIGQTRITKKIDTTTTSTQPARTQQPERNYQENRQTAATRRKTGSQLIEALITYLLTAVLVGILFLIILAAISPAANTTILQLLHIDIHTELINLWQLIR